MQAFNYIKYLLKDKLSKSTCVYNSVHDKFETMSQNINQIIKDLDSGLRRVARFEKDHWVVDQEAKQAILGFYKSQKMTIMPNQITKWYDKIPLKFEHYTENDFKNAMIRAVPQSVVRYGAYIGKHTILMPCYVNIGAYVDDGTTIDTFSTVGSCAQIGKKVHIGGGAGIGGVLEPLQANPTIIEDDCFIGARCEIAEGVIIGKGSVIAMGTMIGQSTKIYHRLTGEWFQGHVPPYSVVVPGTVPSQNGQCQLNAAIIVKTVDERTKSKTSINEILHTFAE